MNNDILAIQSKTIGVLLFSAGLIAYAVDLYGEFHHDLLAQISLAAMAVGFVILLIGMINSFFSQVKKKDSIHHDDGTVAAMALIRCMIAMCIADEDLDEREIALIQKIYKQLMNSDMDKETILYAAQEMLEEEDTDIVSELARINDTLYDELRGKILKASLYILAADGEVDEREEEALELIREGLGYSKAKLQRAKDKFFEERGLQSTLKK